MDQVKAGWIKVFSRSYTREAPCIRKRIIYKNKDFPGIKIVSRRHAETHANGSPGEWTWTEYYVIVPGKGRFVKSRLSDCKLFVQEKRWASADEVCR